jgi:hypothetical protein
MVLEAGIYLSREKFIILKAISEFTISLRQKIITLKAVSEFTIALRQKLLFSKRKKKLIFLMNFVQ